MVIRSRGFEANVGAIVRVGERASVKHESFYLEPAWVVRPVSRALFASAVRYCASTGMVYRSTPTTVAIGEAVAAPDADLLPLGDDSIVDSIVDVKETADAAS